MSMVESQIDVSDKWQIVLDAENYYKFLFLKLTLIKKKYKSDFKWHYCEKMMINNVILKFKNLYSIGTSEACEVATIY